MEDFNILTPGEKIKSIRSKFEFKQEDITGGEVTRNLISIIENNKANLTESVAKILADNINSLCKEKGIIFSVTAEYLLEDVVSQAKKVADEYICYISNLEVKEIILIEDKLIEIDVFFKKYNTEEKKAKLYKIIGGKYFDNRMYSKAIDYYLKSYESSTNSKVTTNILVKLGACCVYLSKYDEAIKYYNLLLDLNNEVQPTYLAKFSTALCNKKLGKFDIALTQLQELKDNFKDTPPTAIAETQVDILLAICLFKLNSFNKSIGMFKELLSKSTLTKEDEVLVLSNLADAYEATRDYSKLNKICSKIKNKIENNMEFCSEYNGEWYISLAKNLMVIGDNESAKDLLLKALESFKTGNSIICLEDVEDMISTLLDMFVKNEEIDNIEFLKNEFFELVQTEMIPRGNLTALKFIRYYNNADNKAEVNNIIEFLAG